MNSGLEATVNNVVVDMASKHSQAYEKMEEMKHEMKERLEKMDKDIVRENQLGQIDFQGLHTYLDNKVM